MHIIYMHKTRSHGRKYGGKHGRTMKMRESCCPATMHGLHKWYEAMFEKLGWMVLAKSRGHTDKIVSYMKSLFRLRKALQQKIAKIGEKDRKDDLEIMCHNLDILIAHAEYDFANQVTGGQIIP